MIKKRWPGPLFAVAALILEALPWGVRLVFASGPEERIYEYTSYFSMLAFGNGHFAPLITAVITCGILVLTVAACCTGKTGILYFIKGLTAVGIVASLLPVVMWLLGMACVTFLTPAVSAALTGEYIFTVSRLKKEKSAP